MSDEQRSIPAPLVVPETEAYWQGAKDGKLMVKFCNSCGKAHHYPRSFCPHCGSPDTEYRVAGGEGDIYSYSVTRRAKVPYTIAYVTLDEGVSMMTNIVDCDIDSVAIGQRVKVVFQTCDDGEAKIPMFTPV